MGSKNIFSIAPYLERAKGILDKMTLSEKVGQTVLYGSMSQLDLDDMRAGKIGALLNVPNVKTANEMQKIAVEETRLGIPLLIGHDVVHGDRTLFPAPLAGSASFDLGLIENAEKIAASEAYREGINWIYSPMVDIARDSRWGRIAEGAGEDKFYGSKVAAARVRGFQTVNPETGYPYAAACFKHYCGYGLSEAGRDYESCDIGERTLIGEYLPVYRAALESGAMTCMSSFNSLNGIPVTGSHYYLTELLRDEWGFEGAVVSDWQSVSELTYHRVVKDEKEAAKLAMSAGCDMDMHSAAYDKYLEEAASEDPSLIKCIDDAVLRILCVKIALGLFENPYREEDNEKYFLTEKNRRASRELAENCMVLLKNSNETLPLKRGKKYLLTGPLADAKFENMGIWGGRGDPATVVTVKDALDAEEGVEIVYIKGCEAEGNDRSQMKSAAREAASCDGIIYVCGEPCQWAGEGGGRVDLSLGALQSDYLKLLSSLRKPLVTVVLCARPLAIENVDSASDAVFLGWQGGVELGNAVKNILLGEVSPSGRLPVTFPRHTGQLPFYYANLPGGRPRWRPDVRSRYRDCETTPLYPYGYGLTYGNAVYSEVKLDKRTLGLDGDSITASVTVKNESDVDIKEVVQAYFCDVVSSVETPERRLCGFEKISLAAGEEKTVSFTFSADDFSFVGVDLKDTVEPGDIDIFIGPDSATGNKETFTIV
ncbi:MAG: glycoside hydrolase family 3 C-terminal domain-containing protein [Clostridia bacterium]|nr:glycoside hydrolase family 3 C-terminal domain-containing protein [Clostridia bacterium]